MKEDLIKLFKKYGVVQYGPVKLSNGEVSDVYLNVKKAYGYPEALNQISEYLVSIIEKKATCIASSGFGGNSLASVISLKKNLNLTIIREKEKDYGKGGLIEYYVPCQTDKIIIVDDVFTTGRNLKKIIEVLSPTGAEILGSYVVVKRGKGNPNIPLKFLLTLEDLT